MADQRRLSTTLRWPRRSAREREDELLRLGFVREAPTRWLDPALLVRSGAQAAVSAAFGRFADRRESQAALDQPILDAATGRDEIWFDFLSDTGDGWPATMTMAWLLGRDALEVDGARLPRGELLLLGGDLVYPAGDRVAYENRFVGPFAGALPWAEPAPTMVAIPGNHDWYDGLVAFTRRFCQGQWIGGWRTWQRRSYAAIELPHRWWVWMLDIQLDELVDDVQLDWFRAAARELGPGDRVILLTGKPSWLAPSARRPFPPAWENLAYIERMIRETGADVGLVLTGDRHHYARYASSEGPPRVTAGGGGAYLSPTHTLRATLSLPPRRGAPGVPYTRAAAYPDARTSRHLSWGVLRLAWLSPGLAGVVGGVHALLATAMLSARPGILSATGVVLALALAAGLIAQLDAPAPFRQLIGAGHAALQVALAALVTSVVSGLLPGGGFLDWTGTLAAAAGAGALAGTTLLALVLLLTSLPSWAQETANQVFAAQGIEDHKNFLRLHIDRDGALHVHALGVDRVCRDWVRTEDDGGRQRFDPVAGAAPQVRRVDEIAPLG